MRTALAQLQPGGSVRIDRDQFHRLATLISRLSERRACRGRGGFHEPIDGFRWWVPLPEYERARAALDALRNRPEQEEREVPDALDGIGHFETPGFELMPTRSLY